MLLAHLAILVLTSAAAAQAPFTINFDKPRQTMQGLGVTATGTWIPEVVDLYNQPAFADRLRTDLGISIIRIALPPEIQITEDLDADTLNLDSFDFTKFNPVAPLIKNLRAGDPTIKVILSIWSPPAWMKSNFATKDGGRLRPDRRKHFAKFCAAACLGFEKTFDVPIYALSIQNEPHFVEPYESCVYTPEEMRDTILAVGEGFRQWSVTTRFMAPEDVASTERWSGYVKALMDSPEALRRVSFLNIHNEPEKQPALTWLALWATAERAGKPLWMTETSGEQPTWIGPEGKPGALDLARKIHDALTHGQCQAWVYWAITDPAPSEFALMALDKPTPKFDAARQFFKFIPPSARALAASPSHTTTLISAYRHDDLHQFTIILINLADKPTTVSLCLTNPPQALKPFDSVRSSATQHGEVIDAVPVADGNLSLVLPPQSVTTLISKY